MKKFLAIFGLILLFSSSAVKAQPNFSLSVHGGYSWVLGVAGADIQYGRFALGGGWMPTKMPISESRINSFCAAITYYQPVPFLKGLSGYVSAGGTTKGYRYEMTSSWGTGEEDTQPMVIGLAGVKYELGRFWLRSGAGYGWCKEAGSFTWESCLGVTLIRK